MSPLRCLGGLMALSLLAGCVALLRLTHDLLLFVLVSVLSGDGGTQEEEEARKCTFRPRINPRSRKVLKERPRSKNISERLHNEAQKRAEQRRRAQREVRACRGAGCSSATGGRAGA